MLALGAYGGRTAGGWVMWRLLLLEPGLTAQAAPKRPLPSA